MLTITSPIQDSHDPSRAGLRPAQHGPHSRRLNPEYVAPILPYLNSQTQSFTHAAWKTRPQANNTRCHTVFETELLAIEGVKAPEKKPVPETPIVEKPAEETEESVVEKAAEAAASVASEAVDAAKTVFADTDEGHGEL